VSEVCNRAAVSAGVSVEKSLATACYTLLANDSNIDPIYVQVTFDCAEGDLLWCTLVASFLNSLARPGLEDSDWPFIGILVKGRSVASSSVGRDNLKNAILFCERAHCRRDQQLKL